ncbi:hypothetical protein K490DRAFT_37092 [Saccharata proteae CBS 121410]|uniref:Uncharacterized protein n=1 Tax=Saccharata proteae CBS 121410 TaxID=1314787 RepID=A0A6A5YD09_9PEZI|nr:hypothetical protein K490DRAFT_37092 [Saccharata proteae CBS 121410]
MPAPVPVPVSAPGPATPDAPWPAEGQAGLALSGIAAAALPPPTDVALPTPQLLRTGQSLRLPSFHALGIAAPHPDRKLLDPEHLITTIGAGPLSKPDDPLHAQSPSRARAQPWTGSERTADLPTVAPDSPSGQKTNAEKKIEVLTPPPDERTHYWGTFAHVRTAAMDSPAKSDSTTPPGPSPVGPPSNADQEPGDQTASAPIPNGWSDPVRILSHALPCPSSSGQAFPHLIQAIHERISPASTQWINVFHAVPGRFNMADLPTSPPSTPGPAIGGEDYFTTKVFDSAVFAGDYEVTDVKVAKSPRPVVPPGTVDVSIVERYIPPTSPNELAGLYSATASRSLLVDRLVELSPNGGTLLFIYPTRTGGRTFMDEYLGPILDPMLRAMHVVHELSADLGASLGHMSAVELLTEFEDIKTKLEAFCRRLSTESSSLDRFQRSRTNFSVVHASKEEVHLDRKVWATDWWIKQEKPRVRSAVTKYFRMAQKLPHDNEIMPTNLIQEILDGVDHKAYEFGGPKRGVEVGVFVIRRTG